MEKHTHAFTSTFFLSPSLSLSHTLSLACRRTQPFLIRRSCGSDYSESSMFFQLPIHTYTLNSLSQELINIYFNTFTVMIDSSFSQPVSVIYCKMVCRQSVTKMSLCKGCQAKLVSPLKIK